MRVPVPGVLEIEIRPGGDVKVHIQGVKGPGCLESQKLLEQILAGTAVHSELTSEYYEQAETQVQINVESRTGG